MSFPRILITALRGGSGKTLLSIGLIAAWKAAGRFPAPFKKGPDYIDAGWLSLAAERPCYNLDTFLIDARGIRDSVLGRTQAEDIAVIEGNRGLYDCISTDGDTSTAELSKLLKTPMILCLDCTKTTRTMAAVVMGCCRFDPAADISGVILNRVAGPRHEKNLKKNIEYHCGIPVLGTLPKLDARHFPERHMGLVPRQEHAWAKESVSAAAETARKYLDMDGLAAVAEKAASVSLLHVPKEEDTVFPDPVRGEKRVRIGIIRDSAFQFYYPENIEALEKSGAQIIFISPFSDADIPDMDGLYIGGGFPETHAGKLADNQLFRNKIRKMAQDGMPVYGECGGLMFLGKDLILDGKTYPMSGVFPISFGLSPKPRGHGYTIVEVSRDNPWFPKGTQIRGHEFHYSHVLEYQGKSEDMVFSMKRGKGILEKKDGICYKNVIGTYTHIHALGTPEWAPAMVRNALLYRGKITGRKQEMSAGNKKT
ncbi:MAG: cobyrinate a,c-diamide synthase [Desulfococcaceae bacterium]|jgi:cobyrinic acid a,c-diamide synthase|nr:cobyrinate a,c-diamide synthase [Desulfococcaceae bacterium]